MKAYYFGCREKLEYRWHGPDTSLLGRIVDAFVCLRLYRELPWALFVPTQSWRRDIGQHRIQGAFQLHTLNAWVREKKSWIVISCWDRSLDPGYSAFSAFAVEAGDAVVSKAELLWLARQQFPDVFARMERAGISIGWLS